MRISSPPLVGGTGAVGVGAAAVGVGVGVAAGVGVVASGPSTSPKAGFRLPTSAFLGSCSAGVFSSRCWRTYSRWASAGALPCNDSVCGSGLALSICSGVASSSLKGTVRLVQRGWNGGPSPGSEENAG